MLVTSFEQTVFSIESQEIIESRSKWPGIKNFHVSINDV